jgi:outer membrane protein assembly factor BamE
VPTLALAYHFATVFDPRKPMQRFPALALLLTLSACTAHKIEIQQGNILSEERLDLVKPGMEQQQVRFALGTPLVQDPFHPERWDYIYQLTVEGEEKAAYRATLHFEEGRLVRIEREGAIPPTERASLERLTKKDTFVRK